MFKRIRAETERNGVAVQGVNKRGTCRLMIEKVAMENDDIQFQKKLLAMFKVEAREHLAIISAQLARGCDSEAEELGGAIETMYREAHSLKGAARAVNRHDIVSLCQSVENVFAALKQGGISLSPETRELLQQTVDVGHGLVDGEKPSFLERTAIKKLVGQLDDRLRGRETEATARPLPERLCAALAEQGGGAAGPAAKQEPAPSRRRPATFTSAGFETVRVPTARLDALLLQAEEMIAVKLALGQRLLELRELRTTCERWHKEVQWQLPTGKAWRGEAIAAPPDVSPPPGFGRQLAALVRAVADDHREAGALIDSLLGDMKKTLLLPFSSLFEVFPRVVRDLARAAGKKVDLVMEGGEIEIDRRVLEAIKDPLLHLLRNCLDHGIETVEEREKSKKAPVGTVKISVRPQDSRIEIAIADDGRGIDMEKIKASAVMHARVPEEFVNRLGEGESYSLLFHSGVTTSPRITDLSGRGLGLPIVREKVERLNGTVRVETLLGAGTTIRMVVPLTLATFRGILVSVRGRIFVLPSSKVDRVARVKRSQIEVIDTRETLAVDGQTLLFVQLGAVLGMPPAGYRQRKDSTLLEIVVVGAAQRGVAFMVDEVLGEQEVLVKPLGGQLSRVRNIMGATVLGDGRVAPVVNTSDLLKSAEQAVSSITLERQTRGEAAGSVLVVEDSITARSLLENILAAAGYRVKTAGNGEEAQTFLQGEHYDIVVSDVEMPRMNGFDLTAWIRANPRLSGLPVVLVTALESPPDRARGIEAGASAYMGKSSFDKQSLLDVVGKLTQAAMA